MKYLLPFLLLLLACQPRPDDAEERFEMGWHGALRSLMHENDLSGKISVGQLLEEPHTFALGAVEGLKGEILIWDGQPIVAQLHDGALQLSSDTAVQAALVVYARVSNWEQQDIPLSVRSYKDLEKFVKAAANKAGIDTEAPFPFLLQGRANTLDYHIIDWKEGDRAHTHEKHQQAGLQGRLDSTAVKLLGFYSTTHHGIFTHHSTNMHLHFMSMEAPLAGHVDGLVLEKSSGQLFLPAAGTAPPTE